MTTINKANIAEVAAVLSSSEKEITFMYPDAQKPMYSFSFYSDDSTPQFNVAESGRNMLLASVRTLLAGVLSVEKFEQTLQLFEENWGPLQSVIKLTSHPDDRWFLLFYGIVKIKFRLIDVWNLPALRWYDIPHSIPSQNDLKVLSAEALFELNKKVNDELANRYPLSTLLTHLQPKDSDVNVVVKDLTSTPVNANPFHHDDISSGCSLVDGWTIMYQTPGSTSGWRGFYLHNSETGQRIGFRLVPKNLSKLTPV